MKTPWHNLLLQYGTAVVAFVVISIGAVILMTVVAASVLLYKFFELIW